MSYIFVYIFKNYIIKEKHYIIVCTVYTGVLKTVYTLHIHYLLRMLFSAE